LIHVTKAGARKAGILGRYIGQSEKTNMPSFNVNRAMMFTLYFMFEISLCCHRMSQRLSESVLIYPLVMLKLHNFDEKLSRPPTQS
jgi:hypothetical protein